MANVAIRKWRAASIGAVGDSGRKGTSSTDTVHRDDFVRWVSIRRLYTPPRSTDPDLTSAAPGTATGTKSQGIYACFRACASRPGCVAFTFAGTMSSGTAGTGAC